MTDEDMTTEQRIARITPFVSKIRGIDRCLDNARRAQGWNDESSVTFWLDQADCYAGFMTSAEFSALHS